MRKFLIQDICDSGTDARNEKKNCPNHFLIISLAFYPLLDFPDVEIGVGEGMNCLKYLNYITEPA
jgi:hypothetical protein